MRGANGTKAANKGVAKRRAKPQAGRYPPRGGQKKRRRPNGQGNGGVAPKHTRDASPTDPTTTSTHTPDPGVEPTNSHGKVPPSTPHNPRASAAQHTARGGAGLWQCGVTRTKGGQRPKRQPTTTHAAQDQSQTDLLGTTPWRSPEGVRHGASPEPLPRGGGHRGGGGHEEPTSWPASTCPVQPLSKTRGAEHAVGEDTTATGDIKWRTKKARSGQGMAQQPGAIRHAKEARNFGAGQTYTATGCPEDESDGEHARHAERRGACSNAKTRGKGAMKNPKKQPQKGGQAAPRSMTREQGKGEEQRPGAQKPKQYKHKNNGRW